MAETSKISWTDSTWNPWFGCTKVSAGCAHCYAQVSHAIKRRAGGKVNWGAGEPRQRAKGWGRPLAMDRKAGRENLITPIFPSLCDIFDVDPSQRENLDQWRDDFFDLIEKTPNLVWLILTKRPEIAALPRWRERILACGANVWIGVSTENQATADLRVPLLLQIPTTNRFISAEPLLGPLDLTPWLSEIPWVILGGESGPHARPMDQAWARKVRDDCQGKTLFHFKQVGGTDEFHGGELLDGEKIQQSPDFAGIVLAAPASAQLSPIMANSTPTTPNTPAPASLLSDTPLSEDEKAYLKERDDIIVAGLQTKQKHTIEAAKALYEIEKYEGPNGRKLWRSSSNFVLYCHTKWGYGQTQAYYQRNVGEFLSSQGIGVMPVNPIQLEKIISGAIKVPVERRVECWNWMVAEAAKEQNENDLNTVVAGLTGPKCEDLCWKFLVIIGLANAALLAENKAEQEKKKVMKAVEVLRKFADPGDPDLAALLTAVGEELNDPERLQMTELRMAQAKSSLEKLKNLVNQRDAGICSQIEKHLGDLDASVEISPIYRGSQNFDEVLTTFQALQQACEPAVRRVELSKRIDAIFGPPPSKASPVSHSNQKSVTNSQSGRRGSNSSPKPAFPDFLHYQ